MTQRGEHSTILRYFSNSLKALVAALLSLLCTAVTLGALSLTDLGTREFWHASQGIVGCAIFASWAWVWLKAMR